MDSESIKKSSESILNKSGADYLSILDNKGELVGKFSRKNTSIDHDDKLSLGSKFFFETGDDYFNDVLRIEPLEYVTLKSEKTHIIFIKNKENFIFSFYSNEELNMNILKLIINKY